MREEHWKGKHRQSLEQFSDDFPFLRYAVHHWYSHAKESYDRSTHDACVEFLQDVETVHFSISLRQRFWRYTASRMTYHGDDVLRSLGHSYDPSVGFIYAAACGLDEVSRIFLARGVDVNVITNGVTALVGAIAFEHFSVVELLLQFGAGVQGAYWKTLCACIEVRSLVAVRARRDLRIPDLILSHVESRELNDGPRSVYFESPKACGWYSNFNSFMAMAYAHEGWDTFDQLIGSDIQMGLGTKYRELLWMGSNYFSTVYSRFDGTVRLLDNSTRPELSSLDRITAMIVAPYDRKDVIVSILSANITRDTFETQTTYLLALVAGLEHEGDEFYDRHLAKLSTTLSSASKDVPFGIDRWKVTMERLPSLTAFPQEMDRDKPYVGKRSNIETTFVHLLHKAAINGWKDTVEILLRKGADPNVVNPFTPSWPIQVAKSKDVIECLVNSGAKVDAQSCMNPTRLKLAIRMREVDIVKYLLSLGADIEGRIEHQHDRLCVRYHCAINHGSDMTNFLAAAYRCHGEEGYQVLRILRDHGANIRVTDDNGRTALHYAVETGDPPLPLVQLLLDMGLDPACKDHRGRMTIDCTPDTRQKGPSWSDTIDLLKAALDKSKPGSESPTQDHKKLPLIKRLTGQTS